MHVTTIYRKRRLEVADLKLTEVARRVGVLLDRSMNRGTLSMIETGRMNPTLEEADAILHVIEAERLSRVRTS